MKLRWIIFTIVLSVTALIAHFFDKDYRYQGIILLIYLVSVFSIPALLAKRKVHSFLKHSINKVSGKDLVAFTFIFMLAVFVRFAFLESYPFVTIGDELRDGGLDALYIVDGTIKNLFGYGHYNGYGTIIPTIASWFYGLFEGSALTYRLPAALLSLADIVMIFVMVRRRYSLATAVMASLVVISLPLHIFWGRSEIVVGANTFIMTSVLFLLDTYFYAKRTHGKSKNLFMNTFAIGILFGFFAGFHVSSRIVVLLGSIVLFGWVVKNHLKKVPAVIAILVIGFFIGFGPRIIETTPEIMFKTEALEKGLSGTGSDKSSDSLGYKYIHTLKQFAFTDIGGSHYPHNAPMVTLPVFAFFLLGIALSLYRRVPLGNMLVFFMLVIPFTHSAVTDSPYLEHRLSSILTPLAMLAGLGLGYVYDRLRHMRLTNKFKLHYVFGVIVFVYLSYVGGQFFIEEHAQDDRKKEHFIAMHAMETIRYNKDLVNNTNLCLKASGKTYEELDFAHTRQIFQFYLPHMEIHLKEDDSIKAQDVHITKNCDADNRIHSHRLIQCSHDIIFFCPKKSKLNEDITIYIDNNIYEQ